MFQVALIVAGNKVTYTGGCDAMKLKPKLYMDLIIMFDAKGSRPLLWTT